MGKYPKPERPTRRLTGKKLAAARKAEAERTIDACYRRTRLSRARGSEIWESGRYRGERVAWCERGDGWTHGTIVEFVLRGARVQAEIVRADDGRRAYVCLHRLAPLRGVAVHI